MKRHNIPKTSKKATKIGIKNTTTISKRKNHSLRKVVSKGPNNHFDAIVIGAGIAGVSAALGIVTPQLAKPPTNASLCHNTPKRVLVIDKEQDFCFHSTGRSAAIYSEVYGSPTIRALSTATKPFYYNPTETGMLSTAEGGTDNDFVYKRGTIWVATKASQDDLTELYKTTKPLVPSLKMISLEEMNTMVPAMRYPANKTKIDYDDELAAIYGVDDGDYTPTLACLEPDAADMDVNAIWARMSKIATNNGAELVNNVELSNATYSPTQKWSLQLRNKLQSSNGSVEYDLVDVTADVVVNASGGWADETNTVLGAKTHKIQPKQRTIVQFLPNEYEKDSSITQQDDQLATFNHWPSVFDMHDRYYFKPDAGRVLASICDEVDVDAADVSPDELTIALNVERMQRASFFNPQNIVQKWAGLRSFAPDREFVLGFDGGNPGSMHITKDNQSKFGKDLIHLTGLGGYGIQSAMGNAVCISGLYHNGEFPQQILDMGLEPSAVCPARF